MRTNKVILFFLLPGILLLQTCKKIEKEMLISTGTASNILITSAVISGKILDLGQGATQYGHCYSKTSDPTIADATKDHSSPTLGDFTSTLEGLDAGTKYFVKAYLSRGKDVVYGNEISFTTAAATLPTVTTTEITKVTTGTAVSGGNVTDEGGTPLKERGVCWSLATITTLTNNKTTDGTGTGTFTSEITGLASGTNYFVRAYATNSGGTKLGNEITFTTTSDIPVQPTVTTAAVISVTSNSAISGGNVTSEGGSSVISRGVCWRPNEPNPTIQHSKTIDGNGGGSFISNLTGLNPGTTYYFRAYATNSAGTSYGTEYNFATNSIVPTLTTIPITTIASTTASAGGDITNLGGSNITVKGVCWSLSESPTVNDSKTTDGPTSVPGTYVSSMTGLSPNTKYYIKSYATNSAGTGYGNVLYFTTLASVMTSAISDISSNSASGGGTVSTGGGANIVARGICWGTVTNPTIANSKTTDGTGTGTFASSLTGLAPNILYFVRAYATNDGGTSYGTPEQQFTTLCTAPSATTNAAINPGITGATLQGTINANGFSTLGTFDYGTNSDYGNTIAALQNPVIGNTNNSVSAEPAGLTSNTLYHFRLKAVNCSPTLTYGNDMTLTTLTSITTTLISYTNTSASVRGFIEIGGGETVTMRGICWSTTPNPTISDSKTTNGPGTGYFTDNLSGLAINKAYYARAYATNSGGTSYGNEINFITPCLSSMTVTHTAGAVAPVTKTVTYGIVQTIISGQNKCWITRNLGADNQASSATDATEAASGWYWQFNLKQGYKHDGTTRTPNSTWITSIVDNSDWIAANDPCTLLLGTGWRIPTNIEWSNADANGGWGNYVDAYASVLKLHDAGYLANWSGAIQVRGANGYYWSSMHNPAYDNRVWILELDSYQALMGGLANRADGFSIRCIKD